MYKIFISYTNKGSDSVIAEQLFNELNRLPFSVFWDKDGLMAGLDYKAALNENLINSDYLIVLWSQNVQQSQWVYNEIAAFRARDSNKIIIPVLLDMNWSLGTEQWIDYLSISGVYTNGVGAVTAAQIVLVANKIRRSIFTQYRCLPIKRVVLTLTEARAAKITTEAAALYKKTDTYGENFSDWTPLDSSHTILQLLDRFLYTDINSRASAANPAFYWDDISWQIDREGIWQEGRSALDTFSAEAASLRDQRCVMIFDPYALNDPDVKNRFDWCWGKCQLNSKALVMSLTYSLKPHFDSIKDFLRWNVQPFYDQYLSPPVINESIIENSFAHVIDNVEMERQLSILLRKQQIAERTGSAFTKL